MSLPPWAVPPSSCAVTLTVAVPFAFAAGVKLRVPFDATDGAELKRADASTLVENVTVWVDSLAAPGEIEVAQPAIVIAPASSSTVWLGPPWKLGATFAGGGGGGGAGAVVVGAVVVVAASERSWLSSERSWSWASSWSSEVDRWRCLRRGGRGRAPRGRCRGLRRRRRGVGGASPCLRRRRTGGSGLCRPGWGRAMTCACRRRWGTRCETGTRLPRTMVARRRRCRRGGAPHRGRANRSGCRVLPLRREADRSRRGQGRDATERSAERRRQREPGEQWGMGEPGERPHHDPHAPEGDAHEGPYEPRVELLAGAADDLFASGGRRRRLLVGARRGDHVVDVGDRDDAAGEGNRFSGDAVRVARAVPTLVVVTDCVRPFAEPWRSGSTSTSPCWGWALSCAHSSSSGFPGLLRIAALTRELADVVEERRPVQAIELRLGEPEFAAERECVGAYPLGVAPGDVVVVIESGDELQQDLGRLLRALAGVVAQSSLELVDGSRRERQAEPRRCRAGEGERELEAAPRAAAAAASRCRRRLPPPLPRGSSRTTTRGTPRASSWVCR